MIWRRTLLLVLVTVTGLTLETAIFGRMTLAGTKPEILLLMTVAIAIGEGPAFGALAGFVTGLMTDAVLQLPQGASALTFTAVGYATGAIRQQLAAPSAWMPMAMVSFATFGGLLFYGGFVFLLGQESLTAVRILRYATFAAIYNALLTPFVFPLVRRLAARLRPPSAVVAR